MSWTANAACRSMDMQMFYGWEPEKIDEAKSVCRRCDVRSDCLDTAFERDELGIWGGTTEAERKEMRRSGLVTVTPRAKIVPVPEIELEIDEDEFEPDDTQILACPSHGDQWAPTGSWSDGQHEYVVLSCGCLVVDGEFIDGLEVGVA